MRQRDAEKVAKRFVARYYPGFVHWHFDICEEFSGDLHDRRKSWSFGLRPDEEDEDYEPYRSLTGYVHRDGALEGLY